MPRRLARILRRSLRALLARRLGSALAASGVAVGIAAVFLTGAIADGAAGEVVKGMGQMGTRLLVVRPSQIRRTAARAELQGFVSSLKPEDGAALSGLPGVGAVAPVVESPVKLRSSQGVVATTVLGTTTDYFRARSFSVQRGRLFDDEEDQSLARLVVLGGRLAVSLFGDDDPVGQEVRIRGIAFEVVGALVPKGVAADGADTDNQAFVPLRTALRRVFNSRSLSAVFVGVDRSEDLPAVELQIRSLLRDRHGLQRRDLGDDFTVQSQLRFLSAQQRTARSLGYLTSALAAVSLLVGGSGILGLMLLSVRERTLEIGLRMALGARRRDILVQFLAEAMALSGAGGVAGAGLGLAGTWIVALALDWPVRVSFTTAAAALGASVAVGLLFGAFPARRAAMLPPVRALGLE